MKLELKNTQDIGQIRTGKYDVNHSNIEGKYIFYTCAMQPFKSDTYSFEGDSIILPGNGANVGQVFFSENQKFEAYQRTYVINKIQAYSKYVYYYFKNNWAKSLKNKQYGSATNYIRYDNIANFRIPLPSLDDQIRIAAVLTRAEKLIAKRKESIKALDELLKSTFWEMFGDPVRNEKGWKKKRIDEIANTRLGKMRDKQFITGKHLKYYLGNSNVRWFSFDFDTLEQMDFDEDEQVRFSLQYGDLLICEGGEIGRCAIWKCEKENLYFQKALHRVRVDKDTVYPEYLAYVFYLYSLGNGFKNVRNKATIAHLTGEKLKETLVPIPPLPLQNQFATIVEKVEVLKARYTRSLAELENLYGSLSQRAFKGELDLSKVPVEKEKHIIGLQGEVAVKSTITGEQSVLKKYSEAELIKTIQSLAGEFLVLTRS